MTKDQLIVTLNLLEDLEPENTGPLKDTLDEIVEDEKAVEASLINTGTWEEQIDYLLEKGYTTHELARELGLKTND